MNNLFEKTLMILLKDYDYEMRGNYLYSSSVAGYPSREIRKFKSTFAAVEYLLPIIREDRFTQRYLECIKRES